MTDTIPPLPELEIKESTKIYLDQQTVDAVLRVVYKLQPNLFTRFAERERENLGVDEYGDEFFRVVHDEVWKVIEKPENISAVAGSLLLEARRRSRLMYGMELRPELNLRPVTRSIYTTYSPKRDINK